MKEFDALIQTIESLLAPNGCPWDREQTLLTMRSSLVEETAEVIEAIESDDNEHLEEELGDLFFNIAFLCKLAEKEKRCDLQGVLKHINHKLIRRHPHVFDKVKIENSDQVLTQWEAIKKLEKGTSRPSLLDGIPKDLPLLARAQKIVKKIKKASPDVSFSLPASIHDEESLGIHLLHLLSEAQEKEIEAELALRSALSELEKQFRKNEGQLKIKENN